MPAPTAGGNVNIPTDPVPGFLLLLVLPKVTHKAQFTRALTGWLGQVLIPEAEGGSASSNTRLRGTGKVAPLPGKLRCWQENRMEAGWIKIAGALEDVGGVRQMALPSAVARPAHPEVPDAVRALASCHPLTLWTAARMPGSQAMGLGYSRSHRMLGWVDSFFRLLVTRLSSAP